MDVPDATPRTGWLLGIDTSSEVVSLALVPVGLDAATGAELTWRAGRNQTATLLSEIDHLCRLCAIGTEAFAGIVVATGPGGFNALRVGMSVAKGFAFALGVPLLGVGTLDIVARPYTPWGLPVRAFVPAGRGRVVFGDFVQLGGRLHQHGEMQHRAPLDLAADLPGPTVLAGELAENDAVALREQQHVVLPGAGSRQRRAAVMVDLAVARWQAGDSDDLTTLEPMYVHQSTAPAPEEPRRRTKATTAAAAETGSGAGSAS